MQATVKPMITPPAYRNSSKEMGTSKWIQSTGLSKLGLGQT